LAAITGCSFRCRGESAGVWEPPIVGRLAPVVFVR
jgi:hypothetical protein